VQIHGSCAGVNTCRGFFYGDWDEAAQLIEHTCSGVNGCAGLSCLTTADEPDGGGMTGEEIMKLDDAWFEERAGQYGPRPCKTCHIVSSFNEDKQDYDYSQLKIPVWASSGRNASNWLKRPAAYQETLVAFGAQGITDEGIRYSNMASYAKLLSKAEIQRVVQYMRSFDPRPSLSRRSSCIRARPSECRARGARCAGPLTSLGIGCDISRCAQAQLGETAQSADDQAAAE
jgi:hypothetical protein